MLPTTLDHLAGYQDIMAVDGPRKTLEIDIAFSKGLDVDFGKLGFHLHEAANKINRSSVPMVG